MLRLGDKLRSARIRQRLSLEDASQATKIRVSFLSAIEDGQYERLPSNAYAEGFVGNYAEFLGLPKTQTIALLRREFDSKSTYRVLPESFTPKKEFKVKRFNASQFVFLSIGMVLVIGYLLFQYRFAFINPPLELTAPVEHAVIKGGTVRVSGKTNPSSSVFVDNVAVPVDENGKFTKTFSSFPGKTTVVVKAENRIGKETVVERHIEVRE